MRTMSDYLGAAEMRLLDNLKLTTHRSRHCPFCRGRVYRERRTGLGKLTLLVGLRPYRCEACDKVHYGFRHRS